MTAMDRGAPGLPALLAAVREPADLREMTPGELDELAAQIRAYLVDTVTGTGGHLGPNLGVVELTIALHRVFDSPREPIVWDTGHQAYVHKLLTGRAASFPSLRQHGGISGYPNRGESRHDLVENSHASTALSYADGLAKALDRPVVAVVGDGALTGGMAWEGLNNIAGAQRRVVIVLNDNGRSYSPTVGALAGYLARLRAGTATSTVFDELGLRYIGPVDGHDIAAVEAALRSARAMDGPVLVHCVTRKGAGYPLAESDDIDRMHAVNPTRPATAGGGPVAPLAGRPRRWTDAFGDALVELAGVRHDVVAVTAAMLHPTGLGAFAACYPDRTYDVGIAEQHAVTSAAGLAMAGRHPVVCIYATFLNRAFDQVLMDVALHRLPVTFVLDRAGITGNDGPSHHGMWDLSLLAAVPGMRVAAPRDAVVLGELLAEAVDDDTGPTALRFPKGDSAAHVPAHDRVGCCDLLTRCDVGDVLIVGVGALAGEALAAADLLADTGLVASVVDPRWALPVPRELASIAARHRLVLTVEDNGVVGGFGDGLTRMLHDNGIATPVRQLALAQAFVEHGSRAALLSAQRLDAQGIAAAAIEGLAATSPRHAVLLQA